MVKKTKIAILCILLPIILFSYILLINSILDNLYPEGKWFDYSLHQSYAPKSCFHVDPNHLTFDNEQGVFSIQTGFEKRCNFDEALVHLTITDFSSYSVNNKDNISMNISRDENTPNKITIKINSEDMNNYQSYRVIFGFRLKEDFYNLFQFNTKGSTLGTFKLVYRGDLLGYFCEGECFSVTSNYPYVEENSWKGKNKKFEFGEGETDVKVKASLQSKKWFFIQKAVDGLALGLIIAVVYGLLSIGIDTLSGILNKKK